MTKEMELEFWRQLMVYTEYTLKRYSVYQLALDRAYQEKVNKESYGPIQLAMNSTHNRCVELVAQLGVVLGETARLVAAYEAEIADGTTQDDESVKC